MWSACDVAPTNEGSEAGSDRGRLTRGRTLDGHNKVVAGSHVASIHGLSIGMSIDDAVGVMNAEAGPIWAATLGRPEVKPFKVLRISGQEMQQIRLQLIQLMSAVTMQLYRVDPADPRDIFIVVPSTAPERANDFPAAGLSVLQSVLFTGFFAWADADKAVRLFIIGPTLTNALFDTALMPMNEFADRFKSAYDVPAWEEAGTEEEGIAYFYEDPKGPSVLLAEDPLRRRTVLVWDSRREGKAGTSGTGDFR